MLAVESAALSPIARNSTIWAENVHSRLHIAGQFPSLTPLVEHRSTHPRTYAVAFDDDFAGGDGADDGGRCRAIGP